MMDDYIRREGVWTALNSAGLPYNWQAMKAINSIPAADVVDRKRGKWIGIPRKTVSKRNRTIHSMVYICPLCRYSNGRYKSNFCPNCGADMRGEDDG